MTKSDRVIEISKKLGLSHIGSNLSMLPVLAEVYRIKKPQDLVLLDAGHCHLSHLLFTNPDKAEELRAKYGTHCDTRAGCDISSGSLGHAGGIGLGMALADRKRDVYVLFSDGSIMEGSNWEALRIKEELMLTNMKCYFNFNGHSAVKDLNLPDLEKKILTFCPDAVIMQTASPDYEGVSGHYIKAK